MAYMKPPPGDEADKKVQKMPTEEDLQKNIQMIEMARNRIEAYTKEAEAIAAAHRDNLRAKETLTAINEMEKPSEILVPIGGGVFIHAKPTKTKKVLLNLGVDVGAEYGIDKAIEKLEKTMKTLEEKEKAVVVELQKIEVSAEALTRETQGMYERMQKSTMEKKGG